MTDDFGVIDETGVTEIARGGGISAWRQIADGLETDIASGALAAGAQLPTESQLAMRFSVNRHTVRRGLAELASRGLVRATQGRGTFVESRPLAYPISARTRFSEIVSGAGREAGGELLDVITMSADARIAAALSIEPGAPVIRIDTVRLADGSPISLGNAYLPLPRFALIGETYRIHGGMTRALEACGVPDYRRLETRISARPASVDEATRLDLVQGRIVLTVDSVNTDMDSQPIQFTRAVFAADRTELVVES